MQTAGQAGGKKEGKKDTNIHTLQTVLCLPFELFGIKERLSSPDLRAVKECERAVLYFFFFSFLRAKLLFDEMQLCFKVSRQICLDVSVARCISLTSQRYVLFSSRCNKQH